MIIQNYCNIIIFNKEGKILMQKREENKKILPGYWALFGGKLENNENKFDGIIREIKEELDINIQNPKFEFSQRYEFKNYSKGKWHIFSYNINNDEIKKLKLKEGENMEWFFPKEIDGLKITKDLLEVIKKTTDKQKIYN